MGSFSPSHFTSHLFSSSSSGMEGGSSREPMSPSFTPYDLSDLAECPVCDFESAGCLDFERIGAKYFSSFVFDGPSLDDSPLSISLSSIGESSISLVESSDALFSGFSGSIGVSLSYFLYGLMIIPG